MAAASGTGPAFKLSARRLEESSLRGKQLAVGAPLQLTIALAIPPTAANRQLQGPWERGQATVWKRFLLV